MCGPEIWTSKKEKRNTYIVNGIAVLLLIAWSFFGDTSKDPEVLDGAIRTWTK